MSARRAHAASSPVATSTYGPAGTGRKVFSWPQQASAPVLFTAQIAPLLADVHVRARIGQGRIAAPAGERPVGADGADAFVARAHLREGSRRHPAQIRRPIDRPARVPYRACRLPPRRQRPAPSHHHLRPRRPTTEGRRCTRRRARGGQADHPTGHLPPGARANLHTGDRYRTVPDAGRPQQPAGDPSAGLRYSPAHDRFRAHRCLRAGFSCWPRRHARRPRRRPRTPAPPDATTLNKLSARLAPVDLTVDVQALPANERAALAEIIAAAKIMDALFLRQAWAGNDDAAAGSAARSIAAGPGAAARLLAEQGPVAAPRRRPAVLARRRPQAAAGELLSRRTRPRPTSRRWMHALPAPARATRRGILHDDPARARRQAAGDPVQRRIPGRARSRRRAPARRRRADRATDAAHVPGGARRRVPVPTTTTTATSPG